MTETRALVVVGVDGSDESIKATKWAADYAAATGATLELVTAWRWPDLYGALASIPNFDPKAEGQALLEKAAADLTLPDEQVRLLVVNGFATQVLTAQAATADLLVVGTRGLGGARSVLLGSVSNYCVHHADCPVVVVR